jgi:hypothetical protein
MNSMAVPRARKIQGRFLPLNWSLLICINRIINDKKKKTGMAQVQLGKMMVSS